MPAIPTDITYISGSCYGLCYANGMKHPAATRFLAKIRTTEDRHWLWTGSIAGVGYGQFWLDGHRIGAHRAAWMIFRGPIPPGQEILHQCVETMCVNPDHLKLGSHSENMLEAVALHKWQKKGQASPTAKLTQWQVDDIRARYLNGELQRVLAREYGVTQPNISYIVRGLKWRE